MNVLGVFRGFPGLGRIVAGVSIMEMLRDDFNCDINIISYLQGNIYLKNRGFKTQIEATAMDYSSIGLLPTNKMGSFIHKQIKDLRPDLVIIDGEPLILHSLRLSYPKLKIVALLNPADVVNPKIEKECMDYFNAMYSQADLAVIHGLRKVHPSNLYRDYISTGTVIRREIFKIKNQPSKNVYCVLGGGTVNVDNSFFQSTTQIATLCVNVARLLPEYTFHVVCSSSNIYDALDGISYPNVILHNKILEPSLIYSDAAFIITRSGRNTLSELAYLGIPSISFISGCTYRRTEQEENLKCLNSENIYKASIDITVSEFADLCKKVSNSKRTRNPDVCGNRVVVKEILKLLQ
jgi:hypothetical protein